MKFDDPRSGKMSLRKFMHERNKYKEEPNFKQLAILYPEFRKVAITDLTGRVRMNFKDEESLRVLTTTLLKHDFDLEVDIPPKKLVPTLPLRLNYILWVEDLLRHSGVDDFTSVHGLDIGTGAACIYPLLFSTMFKSTMTCTDIDGESVNSARKNVDKNKLQDLIKVQKETILKEVIKENDKYSFVMCNPPFFETDIVGKKPKQEPPRNAPTGNEKELAVKGGEREFILRLIQESLELKDNVKIYTTMFGQKSSLAFLKSELKKKDILNVTWTEFCQGFTKRWGIAWTFASKDNIELRTAPATRMRSEVIKMKKDKSMEIIFPAKENLSSLDEVVTALKKWITELNVEMKEIDLGDDDDPCWACQLTASSNTWTHARRKRRMAMHQEALKRQCIENSESGIKTEKLQADQPEIAECGDKSTEKTEPLLVCTLIVGEKNESEDEDDSEEDDEEAPAAGDKKMLGICMLFESGHGGKLSLETLRQYLVNKLNIREFFQNQNPSRASKKKKKKKKLIKDNPPEVSEP